MIKTSNLTIKIDNHILLDNVNVCIPQNKLTIIVGPNGVGKTTFIKTLGNILKASSGNITKDCKEVFFLPQSINYPNDISLFEYLSSIFFRSNWKWSLSQEEKDKIYFLLNTLDLFDKKDFCIKKLSAGELQKANIGLGILSGADLLLLDEPTANMDLLNQIKILDLLQKLNIDGLTCAIVLHDINLAAQYGDFFMGITRKGKIITGTKDEIINESTLAEIYGINFTVITNEKTTFIQTIS